MDANDLLVGATQEGRAAPWQLALGAADDIDWNRVRDELSHVDDSRLIRGFGALLARSRRDKAGLLVFIDEIDRRRLYEGLGHASLFACCTERFHMSESQAGKAIQAARTARRFPVLFGMVARAETHLSGINRLAAHLTDENHADVLDRARHKSIRQIQLLIAEIAPQPDSPTRIRPLRLDASVAPPPARAEDGLTTGSEQVALAFDANNPAESIARPSPDVGATPATMPVVACSPPEMPRVAVASSPSAAKSAARVSPLSPQRYKVELTVGQQTHDNLRALQALMPGIDAAAIVDRAIGELLERTLARKAGLTKRPRKTASKQGKRGRGIPVAIRRDVWERDGGRCAFVGCDGRRCNETHALEFHHEKPYALGGEHSAENVELRCRAHNQHEADLVYGKAFMDAKRGADHTRESLAPYIPRRMRFFGPGVGSEKNYIRAAFSGGR